MQKNKTIDCPMIEMKIFCYSYEYEYILFFFGSFETALLCHQYL